MQWQIKIVLFVWKTDDFRLLNFAPFMEPLQRCYFFFVNLWDSEIAIVLTNSRHHPRNESVWVSVLKVDEFLGRHGAIIAQLPALFRLYLFFQTPHIPSHSEANEKNDCPFASFDDLSKSISSNGLHALCSHIWSFIPWLHRICLSRSILSTSTAWSHDSGSSNFILFHSASEWYGQKVQADLGTVCGMP